MNLSPIINARLTLRPLTDNDAGTIQKQAGDARVARWTSSFSSPISLAQSLSWIQRARQEVSCGTAIILAITRHPSPELIGVISLQIPDHQRPHLGYWLGADHWRNGYCTEAVRAIIAYGFDQSGLPHIVARCDDANIASKKVMLRCGMTSQPVTAASRVATGRQVKFVDYSITHPDYC